MERKAIIMISIGDREWSRYSAKTFEKYAKKCDAEFIRQTSIPDDFDFPDLPDKPGRVNKKIYALKAFIVWKYLHDFGYDRILVVDDSCCVTTRAPSIFDKVPYGSCGYTTTSYKHAYRSFADIETFIEERGEASIELDDRKYMNTGVMVYDQSMKHAFHPDEIRRCQSLLFADYPNQTLTYYLLMRHGVSLKAVSKNFNRIPGSKGEDRRNMTDASEYLDQAFIHHFTGGYRHRDILVPQMSQLILDKAGVE